ncbi:MAG: pyridoxal-phosphate dependent enzyme [Spirochaetota bacterium]
MSQSRESDRSLEQSLNPLDGAGSDASELLTDLESQRRVAAAADLPVEARLEAFEDIFESQVGDTTLSRARNIEREAGVRQLFLKFEGGNPTGTQKDRIAFAQAMDALRRGFDALTVATCGNYGAAVAFAAYLAGLRCYIYVPETYRTDRMEEMRSLGAEVIRVAADYERAVRISQDRAREQEIYDANPGGGNTSLQIRAYGEIAYEIYDELRDAPAVVAVPVSNGTTLAGVYHGFVSLYRRGKTSRIPRLFAGSSYRKNPIIQAFLDGSPRCVDLQVGAIQETRVNEPLINWHAADGDQALEAVRRSGGLASYVSDRGMLEYARRLRDTEGLNALPASTAGLIVLRNQHRSRPLPSDRYVAILTGRK